jgi:VanZ family protein
LAFTAGLWISPDRWKRRALGYFFLIAAIASVYGITDEFHQSFVPGRDANIWDWLADTIGACIGAGLAVAAGKRGIFWLRNKQDNKQ